MKYLCTLGTGLITIFPLVLFAATVSLSTLARNVHRFFANTGAVAGVFLVVGIVATAFAAIVAFALCKRRRRRHIRNSISRPLPYPENPFEDPRESPSPTEMRYSDAPYRNVIGGGVGLNDPAPVPPAHTYTLYETPEQPSRPSMQMQNTLAGVSAGNRQTTYDPYREMRQLKHQSRPSYGSTATGTGIGLALTSDDYVDYDDLPPPSAARAKHASLTPSTPSIYPATLPEDDA